MLELAHSILRLALSHRVSETRFQFTYLLEFRILSCWNVKIRHRYTEIKRIRKEDLCR
jgi:hypothetical protein